MANDISIYDPRVMGPALAQMKPARQFLRKLFFSNVETHTAEKVDVDVIKGQRRLAPFINPLGPAKAVDRIGFSTSSVTPPTVAPKRQITVQDLQTRLPGEHIYAQKSPEDRARDLLGRDLADLDDQIARREEWMCAQALLSSEIDIKGEGVDYKITFPRDSSVKLGLIGTGDRWSNSNADIPAWIKKQRRAVVKLTGLAPDILVAGSDAADALLAHPKLVGQSGALNTRLADLGLLAPEIKDDGAIYIGRLAGTNIDIWSYDEWFIDPVDGVEKPLIGEKQVLFGSTKAQTAMRYGAVPVTMGAGQGADIGLVAARRVPEYWVDRDPPIKWLKVSARPIPVPVQNDAFLTAQVIA